MIPGFVAMRPLRAEGDEGRSPSISSSEDRGPRTSEDSSTGIPHAQDLLQLLDQSWLGTKPRRDKSSRPAPAQAPQFDPSSPLLSPHSNPPTPTSPGPVTTLPETAAAPLAPSCFTPYAAVPAAGGLSLGLATHSSQDCTAFPPAPEAPAGHQLWEVGTWAQRQSRLLPRDLHAILTTPDSNPGQQQPAGWAPATARRPPRGPDSSRVSAHESAGAEEEKEQEAAWRYRFTRKWQAEQFNAHRGKPMSESLLSGDGLDALLWTQACGVGASLQFNSPPKSSGMHRSQSCQFELSGHGGSLALGLLSAAGAAAEQPTQAGQGCTSTRTQGEEREALAPWLEDPAGSQHPSATTALRSTFCKAQELLLKQQEIEREAQSRWDRSLEAANAEEVWAGQFLRAVEVSMLGRFPYVVLRACDGKGRQRFLLRGQCGSSPEELAKGVAQEANAVCVRKGLPQLSVIVLGEGIMEWREDTGRHLTISAACAADGFMPGGSRRGPTVGPVAGLAASLVRQVLPCHFRVTTDSDPSRQGTTKGTLRVWGHS